MTDPPQRGTVLSSGLTFQQRLVPGAGQLPRQEALIPAAPSGALRRGRPRHQLARVPPQPATHARHGEGKALKRHLALNRKRKERSRKI